MHLCKDEIIALSLLASAPLAARYAWWCVCGWFKARKP